MWPKWMVNSGHECWRQTDCFSFPTCLRANQIYVNMTRKEHPRLKTKKPLVVLLKIALTDKSLSCSSVDLFRSIDASATSCFGFYPNEKGRPSFVQACLGTIIVNQSEPLMLHQPPSELSSRSSCQGSDIIGFTHERFLLTPEYPTTRVPAAVLITSSMLEGADFRTYGRTK